MFDFFEGYYPFIVCALIYLHLYFSPPPFIITLQTKTSLIAKSLFVPRTGPMEVKATIESRQLVKKHGGRKGSAQEPTNYEVFGVEWEKGDTHYGWDIEHHLINQI